MLAGMLTKAATLGSGQPWVPHVTKHLSTQVESQANDEWET